MSEHGIAGTIGDHLSNGDIDALVALYADDAKVVSYSSVAEGPEQIRALFDRSLATHGSYQVLTIDQFQEAGDVVMWDASVRTEAGILQTTHVVVLEGGKITHHVPGIRGYWGM